MFLRAMAVGAFSVNCYVLGCESTREAAVVDPGADWKSIFQAIQADGYRVTWIINTHSHPDHTGGNAYLKHKTGAPLLIHALDAPSLKTNTER